MRRSPQPFSLLRPVLPTVLALVVAAGLVVGPVSPATATVAGVARVAAAPVVTLAEVDRTEAPRTTVDRRAPSVSRVLRRVLSLVNTVRATGQRCGGVTYPSVPAVRLDTRLNRAAGKFARQMGNRGFFSHTSPDGSGPGDRIRAEGYRWRKYGENIAAGYGGAVAVVTAWLTSPGHCKNLMGRFAEIGLGHAYVEGSPYGHYWVQDFATHR